MYPPSSDNGMQLSRGHMVYKLYNVAENCIFPTQKGAQWAWALLLTFVVLEFLRGLSEKSESASFSTLSSHRQVLCFSMYLYFFLSSIRYCWASSSGPYRFPGHFLLDSNEPRTKETVAAMCFAVLFVFHSQILPHTWVGQIDQQRKWKIVE